MKHGIDLGPIGEASLQKLADTFRISKEDAIIRALAMCSGLTDEVLAGNEVVLRRPDGTIKTLSEAA